MSVSIDWIVGLESTGVRDLGKSDYWEFSLGDDVHFNVASPWRIVRSGCVKLGHCDHQQQFGLPQPVDAEVEATQLLAGRRVLRATLIEHTADVVIDFEGGIRLDVFNNSSGYEGWQLSGGNGRLVVGMGGGEVTEWGPGDAPNKPLQPTRDEQPNGQREPSDSGPRG